MDKQDVYKRMGVKAAEIARIALHRAYCMAMIGNHTEALTYLREAEGAYTRAGMALAQGEAYERADRALEKSAQCARGGSAYRRINTLAAKAKAA